MSRLLLTPPSTPKPFRLPDVLLIGVFLAGLGWNGAALAAPPTATKSAAKPAPGPATKKQPLPAPPANAAKVSVAKPAKIQLKHVRKLVLDPGHGGSNLGAVGALGLREKVVCLAAAHEMAAWLRANSDLEVRLTREDDRDIGLRERPRLANSQSADAFVSIHANAHEKTAQGQADAHGIEVFFLAADASVQTNRDLIAREEGVDPNDATAELPVSVKGIVEEMALATAHRRSQILGAALAEAIAKLLPEARFRGLRQAGFGVLKEAKMPALVLEIGYLTHPVEGPALRDRARHQQMARAMLQALVVLDGQLALEAAQSKPAAKAATPAGPKGTAKQVVKD
jgi:N-acetylmuramoyl-L-alanine amidase